MVPYHCWRSSNCMFQTGYPGAPNPKKNGQVCPVWADSRSGAVIPLTVQERPLRRTARTKPTGPKFLE